MTPIMKKEAMATVMAMAMAIPGLKDLGLKEYWAPKQLLLVDSNL